MAQTWRCPVCNYIHHGDAPPATCPVCTAPGELFVEESVAGPEPVAEPEPKTAGGRRWRCTVCGHIHEGAAPPDRCPVCQQPWSKFVAEIQDASASPETSGLGKLIEAMHAHPVTSHMPNGGLPLSLLAWVTFLVVGEPCLALASTLLVAVAALAAPVTFVTGWSDASTRFGSSAGGVFGQKKTLGITLVIVCLGVTAWRVIAGIGQAPSGAAEITAYSAALLVANGLAVRLGMLGGKLVFGH